MQSTLLDILAGRKRTGAIQGTIAVGPPGVGPSHSHLVAPGHEQQLGSSQGPPHRPAGSREARRQLRSTIAYIPQVGSGAGDGSMTGPGIRPQGTRLTRLALGRATLLPSPTLSQVSPAGACVRLALPVHAAGHSTITPTWAFNDRHRYTFTGLRPMRPPLHYHSCVLTARSAHA